MTLERRAEIRFLLSQSPLMVPKELALEILADSDYSLSLIERYLPKIADLQLNHGE